MNGVLAGDAFKTTNGKSPLLALDTVAVDYYSGRFRPPHRALDGVSAEVFEGDTLAVVGESGSGKTTMTKAILGYVPIASGSIRFDSERMSEHEGGRQVARGRDLQIIYQDPFRSLSPTRTIGQTLAEPVLAVSKLAKTEARERVDEMLRRVGLPLSFRGKYPGELSGGERQRVAIARALMRSPRLVLCDEPVSALDVSIQGQILNLLADLQAAFSLSYLFISHDISVVRHFADRVLVLYQGRVMEVGTTAEVCDSPIHPYTRALLDAVPDPDPEVQRDRRSRRRASTRAAVDPSAGPSNGCVFADRCAHTLPICREVRPSLASVGVGDTQVACHLSIEMTHSRLAHRNNNN